jgi:ribosomal protein L12E/L44/L45/RPP1/RPP2
MQLRAFISYSTADKHLAGQVKAILNEYSIVAFLAHDDIHVSQEWKDRLIQELNETNIIVPLLSASFKKSEWAPQEIGIAFARKNVLFIPLSVDGTVPFGFISHIQGKPIPASGVHQDLLIEPIITRFTHEIIPNLIDQLSRAGTFRSAEAIMSLLVPHFYRFNDAEIDRLVTASIKNDQIWNANGCRQQYLPEFLRLHRLEIAPEKLKALEYQMENRQSYQSELVRKIIEGLPRAAAIRMEKLIAKRQSYTITEDELQELIRLTDESERLNVEKMKYLLELAHLRGVTLDEVMKQLGIEPATA